MKYGTHMHIDPLNHPDVPKIRNVNDLAECLIVAAIAVLVNEREVQESGCTDCEGGRHAD